METATNIPATVRATIDAHRPVIGLQVQALRTSAVMQTTFSCTCDRSYRVNDPESYRDHLQESVATAIDEYLANV